jgi:hypothetical protein
MAPCKLYGWRFRELKMTDTFDLVITRPTTERISLQTKIYLKVSLSSLHQRYPNHRNVSHNERNPMSNACQIHPIPTHLVVTSCGVDQSPPHLHTSFSS